MGLFTLLVNKIVFNFNNFYILFNTFSDLIISLSSVNFKGINFFYENNKLNSCMNINILSKVDHKSVSLTKI